MPPTHRVRPPLRRVDRDDSGFTIVEAMVAFVLLAVVSAASVVAVVNATKASKGSTDRGTAANLAQRDLQAARSLRYPTYPAAYSNKAVTVGKTTYKMSRSVTSGAIGVCPTVPDFTNRPFMVVTTTVTWPRPNTYSDQQGLVLDRVVAATEIAC